MQISWMAAWLVVIGVRNISTMQQGWGGGGGINVWGGGGGGSPFSNPPLAGALRAGCLKKPFSHTPPFQGGFFGIAHRAPFSAMLDQKTLKHLWWTKI